jgi:hypothetical protein
MPTRAALLVAVGALLLGACSDDDGGSSAATSTSSLDPGVTFEDDITVPTNTDGEPTATTVAVDPADVETTPREVPDEFPESFPVPDDATVEVGSVGHATGELRVAADYSLADADPADTLDFYRDAIARHDDWNLLLDDADGRGQELIGQLVFETNSYVGNVLVSGDGDAGVLLTLTATLPE